MTTPLVDFLWPQPVARYTPTPIFAPDRKQSAAHKSGRLFFGMDVRGSRTSSQDDAEDRYSLDGRGILNFGKKF